LLSKARPLGENLPTVPGEMGEGEDDVAEEADEASVFGGAFDD
jgi:hypothetical protein